MFRRSIYKSPAQLLGMREPGVITAAALDAAVAAVRPGVTTSEVDAAAEAVIRARGAEPNFMLVRDYRHATCVSVNDQVVHGIPGNRVLEPGDIVSIDCGAQFKGWNADSARTLIVPGDTATLPAGALSAREELSRVAEGSLWAGIAALAEVRTLNGVGAAIERYIRSQGDSPTSGKPWGILREYVGHGIGRRMHEAPSVFNYRTQDPGPEVRAGLVLAIEPMLTAGTEDTHIEDDGWTVTTNDGSDGSHWEHSVAVHDGGLWVLTAPDGGRSGLAPFGIVPQEIGA